jgi:hypothetical protein
MVISQGGYVGCVLVLEVAVVCNLDPIFNKQIFCVVWYYVFESIPYIPASSRESQNIKARCKSFQDTKVQT